MTVDGSVAAALRLGLAGVIALGIWGKLNRPSEFTAAVAGYQRSLPLLGLAPLSLVKALILLVEAGALAGLLSTSGGVAVCPAAGLFLAYAALMAGVLVRGGQSVDCGCSWGAARQPVSAALMARNLVLALVAGVATQPAPLARISVVERASILVAAGLVLIVYAASTTLIANASNLEEARP